MKVSCQLCGKKFDLKTNNYRCPDCAAHYHGDAEIKSYVQEYDRSKHAVYDEYDRYDEEYDCDYDYEDEDEEDDYELNQEVVEQYRRLREKKAVKEAKTKKRIKAVLITMEVIIIIFFILMPFLGEGFSRLQLEKQRIEEKPLVEEVYINEHMPVGYYGVIVRRCYIDDSSRWMLPDNYVVYAVEYDTEERALHEDDELGEPENNKYNLYDIVEIYLETESGPTIAPLDRYSAEELMDYDAYEATKDEIGAYIKYDGGILYFVVKEDEEIYGLCFDYYETPDKSDEDYRELCKVYFMNKIDWEVE